MKLCFSLTLALESGRRRNDANKNLNFENIVDDISLALCFIAKICKMNLP